VSCHYVEVQSTKVSWGGGRPRCVTRARVLPESESPCSTPHAMQILSTTQQCTVNTQHYTVNSEHSTLNI